jgi:antitoxin component YwqK of YwqJK toxin-antitoxin module
MTRPLLPIILLLAALHAFGEDLLYRSNDFGMLLARIAPYQKDDSRWILRVRRNGLDEERRLYDNGKEVRRWETTWNKEHTVRVEKEIAGGVLAARSVYDASGSLLQEEEYTAGALSKKTLFTYANGRLSLTRVLAGVDGRQVSAEVYLYAANGGLREVRRTAPPGETTVSSSIRGNSGLSEQRSSMEGSLFIERYDTDGKLINRERRADGVPVSIEDFAYDPGTRTLVSSVERLPAENGRIERRYDEAGRLSQETSSVKGATREIVAYGHDEKGNVISKTRRGPEGLEAWKYSYSASGDLSREEYFLRGVRVKITIHGEGKLRTEELYREGELFLKVFYDGDTRLREDVYSDGSLQRERNYQ